MTAEDHLRQLLATAHPAAFPPSTELVEDLRASAARGAALSFAPATDPAYADPARLMAMLASIDALQERYVALVAERAAPARAPALRSATRAARRREHEALTEAVRAELIYEPTDAHGWHAQRGRATALVSIARAHDIAPGQRVAADLPLDLLAHRFSPTAHGRHLTPGSTLEQAVIDTCARHRDGAERAARICSRLSQFLGEAASAPFLEVVRYCSDGIGIRERRAVVHSALRHALAGNDNRLVLSVGSGTALPLINAMATAGPGAHLVLIDSDPVALACAEVLAQRAGVSVEVWCQPLLTPAGRLAPLEGVLGGRRPGVVEDSGLREYLPDLAYTALTRALWAALEGGGTMISANMLTGRPQAGFLHGLMGWRPRVSTRTTAQSLSLHRRAGVPAGATQVTLTAEGVYAIYLSRKSAL